MDSSSKQEEEDDALILVSYMYAVDQMESQSQYILIPQRFLRSSIIGKVLFAC